jgi:hypothetical protein
MCLGENSWPCDDVGLIIDLIGVVFHGTHGRVLNTQTSFTSGKLPLTAPATPVTL